MRNDLGSWSSTPTRFQKGRWYCRSRHRKSHYTHPGQTLGSGPTKRTKLYTSKLARALALTLSVGGMLTGISPGYAQQSSARVPVQAPLTTLQPPTKLCDTSEEANVRPIWQGEDGWLFGRPDLITALQIPKTALPYLAQLAAALKAKGVTPVALIVPTRGSVAYTQMGKNQVGENPALTGYDPEAAARSYRTFLTQLQAAGFIAPDLLTVAQIGGKAFFFRRDHHWTPAAARVVAKRVAAQLETRLATLPKTAFVTRQEPSKTQLGTLQRRAEAFCPGFSLPLESVSQFSTTAKAPKKADSAALFSAAKPEIVLVGTSNSHRGEDKPELNFDGFLRQAMSREILNVSFPGAGVYGSLEAYLLSSEYRQAPPKILLWETTYMSWHRRSSLETEQRQVLPSVYGACSRSLARRTVKTLPEGKAALLGGLNVPPNNVYLQLELDDPSLVKFDLELRYRGYTVREHISRTTRVPNSGVFFYDLRDLFATPLAAVTLDSPKAASGGARVSLCSTPTAPPR